MSIETPSHRFRLAGPVRETIRSIRGYCTVNARVSDLESFVAEHRQGVHRYLTRMVGRAEAAQDLTQEVFLRATRAGVPLTTDIGRRAWIFRIARNLALNHLRDGHRRPEPVALVERGTAATQEVRFAVRQALAALPDADRDVFLLRESAGLSYEEIAATSDTTTAAVRSRLYRVRLALRETLAGYVNDQRRVGIRWTNKEGHDGD
ncbi:MAG TPA: sigma-70 family RNA polymerase sigma factor [Vicinamibacterales bacterium]|nr:sigma-70 family RNA polymerase sigma factor [Vicinamibacterales bacterium]